MDSYTKRSDELERQAEGIDHCQDVEPLQSCYETLLEEQALTEEAKELRQEEARSIRKKFAAIISKDFALRTSTLLREAVISIRKEKLTFSWNHLIESCQIFFENFIHFKSPNETRHFWFRFYNLIRDSDSNKLTKNALRL